MAAPGFDVDAFLGTKKQDKAEQETASAPAAPAPFDVDSFLGKTPGEADPEMPDFLSGASVDTPVAGESAVDVADRFKLALGDKAGKEKYLKAKFGADNVQPNSMGMLSIKGKDNKWRLVDPDTLDAPDSWSLTERLAKTGKETVSEVVEMLPEAVRMASGLGKVAGIGTLGTTAVAGAAADIALTSMGRAFGTYSGDKWDQIKSATFEGTLNALGWGFEKGAKPTASFIAKTDMFKKLSSGMSKLADDELRMLGPLLNWTTGGRVTEASIDAVKTNGKQVDDLIKTYSQVDHTAFADTMKEQSVKIANQAADALEAGQREIAGKLYGSVADDVVEGSFKASNADFIDPVMNTFAKDGVVKIAGMSPQESIEMLAKQNGKLVEGQKWQIANREELKTLAQLDPSLPPAILQAAADPKAYAELVNPLQTMQNYRSFAAPTGSKEQVKKLIDLRKSLSKITYDAKSNANASAISNYFVAADAAIDGVTKSVLPESAIKKLAQADSVYQEMIQTTGVLRKLSKASDQAQANQFINALFSRGGGGTERRNAFGSAIKQLTDNGATGAASQLAKFRDDIIARKAAVDFTTPIYRQISPMQQTAIGAAVLDAADGESNGVGVAALGAFAAASPKIAYKAIKTQLGANALIRTALRSAKTPVEQAAARSGAIKTLLTSGLRVAEEATNTKEQLLQQVPKP